MSDGALANHWPATDVDATAVALVGAGDLAGIVQRISSGAGTIRDRMALVDLAAEIETDAPGTELAELATALRRLAGVWGG